MQEEKQKRVQLGADSVPLDQWRKFHKVTPIAKLGSFWAVIVTIVFLLLQNIFESLENMEVTWGEIQDFVASQDTHILVLIGLGALLGISLLIVLFTWVSWRKMSYAVVENGIHWRRGVIFVKHTQMRWDRVQTVDVEQTLFGRIFGFASVEISSGGTDKDIKLGLLRLADCAKLRSEILRVLDLVRSGKPAAFALAQRAAEVAPNFPLSTAHSGKDRSAQKFSDAANAHLEHPQLELQGGMHFVADGDIPITDVDQNETDILLYQLSFTNLLLASLLTPSTIWMILLAIPVIAIPIIVQEGYVAIIFAVVGLVWNTTKSLFDDYGTQIYLSENGLRQRSGATTVKTRTYPPQRIHAVQIHQPIIWRWLGLWQIFVTVAGNNVFDGEEIAGKLVLAAPKADALRILWAILPKLGTDNDVQLVQEALEGSGTGQYFQGASQRAKLLDPISLPGRGFLLHVKYLSAAKGDGGGASALYSKTGHSQWRFHKAHCRHGKSWLR
ncbi:PH domain-containing protein [Arcanobacterium hippocoleae]|uniref:PH domain-containing protein n=1 Tax=Arcanobacterium hippocoleae TaxID=149017 RepID=UPI00333E6E12